MADTAILPSEFERIIKVDELENKGSRFSIEASKEERAALADRFRILSIDLLKADVAATPVNGDEVDLTGQVSARVVQACVVSAEPVEQIIEAPLEIRYSPHADEIDLPDPDSTEDIDPSMYDLPEPLINGQIDIGEAVAQEVALCLDPYPRNPNATLVHESVITEEQAAPPSPFQKLASLKDKLK